MHSLFRKLFRELIRFGPALFFMAFLPYETPENMQEHTDKRGNAAGIVLLAGACAVPIQLQIKEEEIRQWKHLPTF